jgi:hypothetical protein
MVSDSFFPLRRLRSSDCAEIDVGSFVASGSGLMMATMKVWGDVNGNICDIRGLESINYNSSMISLSSPDESLLCLGFNRVM